MGGRFSRGVPGIELGEGTVDVVKVERDERDHPLVVVDLEDAEHLGEKWYGPVIAAREAETREDQAPPGGSYEGRWHLRGPQVGGRPRACDLGVSTMSSSRTHPPAAIVIAEAIGQY